MCDQLRWDSLGFMSDQTVYTPNIDKLANEGVVFDNAYSAVPSCIAARAGLLTGLNQSHHGRTGYQDGIPWDYKNTLPKSLSDGGYHTQAIGKNHFYPPRTLCGYHNCVLHDGYLQFERLKGLEYLSCDDYLYDLKDKYGKDADTSFCGVNCNAYISRTWAYDEHMHPTSWATTQAIDFLRRKDERKPFFLKLSFVAPHPPYLPSANFLKMYDDVEVSLPVYGDWSALPDNVPNIDGCKGLLPDKEIIRMKKAYYASITQIDYQIGRLMMHLEAEGVLDNTVIMFTSDHGEMLGDHYMFRKAVPFNGSARIPLIINDKRKEVNSQHIDKVVELRDILPTVLDYADIPLDYEIDGKSLLPLIDSADNPDWRKHLHGEHCLDGLAGYEEIGSSHYIVTEKEKYIWSTKLGKEMYFDLEKDPDELHECSSSNQNRVEELRKLLISELVTREEGFVKNNSLICGRESKNVLDFIS